ncbi:MAG: carbon-nitrogen hydrolase family protein [Saprospiraceae bacterium]
MSNSLRIAIIQESPVYLQLKWSLEKAESLIQRAAAEKVDLIVFGETWLTGYPAWLDICPNVALWDHEPTKEVFAKMHANSISVPSAETDLIGKWARQYGVTIVMGCNEVIKSGIGQGTIFNSILTFNNEGQLVNHHRKLMPTYTEKLLYSTGDGAGLKTVDTPFGKLGSLICWEHWMPLTRQAMHNEGEIVHLALWPAVVDRHIWASRHYAFEGRCFVVAVGQILRVRDLPTELDLPEKLDGKPDEMILNGGSCIFDPSGHFVLQPQYNREDIIIAEIPDLAKATRERMTLDVTGHYQRPDVFDLQVDKRRLI